MSCNALSDLGRGVPVSLLLIYDFIDNRLSILGIGPKVGYDFCAFTTAAAAAAIGQSKRNKSNCIIMCKI